MYSTTPDDSIGFEVANPDIGNQPIIYTGTEAVLNVSIKNNTGADIKMENNRDPSNFEVFMPGFFTDDQKKSMTITDISLPDWEFKRDTDLNSMIVLFKGADGTVWKNGESIQFKINKVYSDATPTMDTVQVNINNFIGDNILGNVDENLSLNKKDDPVNTDLTKVLQVNVDNQGNVFVSAQEDPLTNTIYLNFKNIGANPLYNDKDTPWTGQPQVTVTFVYGSTAGSLAPDAKSTASIPGSAWLITVGTTDSQNWSFKNPAVTDQANSPSWVLYPTQDNKTILGTGDQSNVTFAFSNINSFTPAGHTQMYVQFANFPATSKVNYNTAQFIVDVVKQDPPPTRGLLSFFGTNTDASIINIDEPTDHISIPLRWSMFYVDKVKMICNIPGVMPIAKDYYKKDKKPPVPALNYDDATLVIPMQVAQNTSVFITLQAFNHENAYLNALQFTVFISVNFFIDPDGYKYRTIFINNQTWFADNYNYRTAGSMAYNNETQYRKPYGLLYTLAAAQLNTPAGWRLPSQKDWADLIKSVGDDAFKKLMVQGDSTFDAQLGGSSDSAGQADGRIKLSGFYWSGTANPDTPGNNFMAGFYSEPPPGSVNALGSFPQGNYLSVRYVKNS